MSLEKCPDDVKLAVDLIVLLEENQIPACTVPVRAGYCKTRL